MLNINPETVCFIIAKAREFQAKEEVVIPEAPLSPADDWALQVLADHADDLCVQEVEAVIADLEPDQEAELVALMWLGRGDYDLGDWDGAVNDAADQLTDHTAQYLLAHPLVADYLQEGLIQHGCSCED
ncbi:MAG TPA: DUF3775 domain-containing protein [Sedimenticola sp.]|nr:DUF3775 domain-containing protein [Sedimenticola sp.]